MAKSPAWPQEKEHEEDASGIMLRGPVDGLWSWSIVRDKVQYSHRWKAILGFDRGELGTSISEWYDRIHPDDKFRVKQGIQNHLERTNSVFQDDFRMLNKKGAWIWVHAFGVALFDKNGVAARMVGSLCSIVQKKEVAESSRPLQGTGWSTT